MNSGNYNLKFYTRTSDAELVASYGETLGTALEYYTKKWGMPEGGKDLAIVQIDDESLEYYSQQGIIFMADRFFNQPREITQSRLQREAAFQWWGLTVGLKSFDDAWLSQGLAEYSAFSLRETQTFGSKT